MKKPGKFKLKTNKALSKRVKITGTGKMMRSHQLRSGHLRRNKSNKALRRHRVPVAFHKTTVKAARRMLGLQ